MQYFLTLKYIEYHKGEKNVKRVEKCKFLNEDDTLFNNFSCDLNDF